MSGAAKSAIDLHTHSSASDGVLRPSEAVALAARLGLQAIALTDHDTIAGHVEAQDAGHALNVLVVAGIEISALEARGEVHVLGYGVRDEHGANTERRVALQRIRALKPAREERAQAMLAKLAGHGIKLDWQAIKYDAGDAMIGRPHIARALLAGGHVDSLQHAFSRWIGEGGPAFVPHRGLTLASAIALIHATGGVAVLAHPALFAGSALDLITLAVQHAVDGIEINHPSASNEDREAYVTHARSLRLDLIFTGGSDFHGHVSERHEGLGSERCDPNHFAQLQLAMRHMSAV